MADITGTNGNDTLSGTDASDLIRGLDGNDILNGSPGGDTLEGGAGQDSLTGGTGNDVLNGGDDDDQLYDSGILNQAGGSDILNGGGGNDLLHIYRSYDEQGSLTLNGGDGEDRIEINMHSTSHHVLARQLTVDAGTGDDRVDLGGSGFAADITLGSGRDTIRLLNLQSFLNWRGFDAPTSLTVRDFAAGDGGDILDWTAVLPINLVDWDQAANPFGSGHARLVQDGADTLLQIDIDGGADDYRTLLRFQNVLAADFTAANFSGYAPDGSAAVGETLTGTSGGDILTGTVSDDVISGHGGNDQVEGLAGADQIFGDDGNDHLIGGMGDDRIEGGDGVDYIEGGPGSDLVYGGEDDDLISDSSSDGNELYGEGGNDALDVFYRLHHDTGTSYLDGGEGDDRIGVSIYSESHVDVSAGSGADRVTLAVERGSANVSLGAGTDTVRLDFYPSGFNFVTGTIVLEDFVAGDSGERLEFRHHLARVLDGWDPATNPFATGHLRLVQSGTSAVLEADFLYDGKGFVPYVIFENTNAAALTPYNLDMLDSLVVYGTEDRDVIEGSAGDDAIEAFGGIDSIIVTPGHDTVDGGEGSDWLDVVAARMGLPAGPRDYVFTADRLTNAAGTLDTSFTGIEKISVDDRTANVTVDASAAGTLELHAAVWAGAHLVKGGAGDDQISVRSGGSGSFDGGAGRDWLWVERENSANGNLLFVTESAGVVTLSQAGSASVTGRNFELLGIVGTLGALRVDASAVALAIDFSGTASADTIIGSSGANQIDSRWNGLGAGDMFTGGGGNDWFTFWNFAGLRGATITDFDRDDRIDLHLITGLRFIGEAGFSGAAGEIRYEASGGQTRLIGDADGDGVGESVLTLANREMTLRETYSGSQNLVMGPERVIGTEASETLSGTALDEEIRALGGNDTIKVSRGVDSVDGGAGTDTLELDAATLGLGAGAHSYTANNAELFDGSGAVDTSFVAVERLRLIDITGSNVSFNASASTAAVTITVQGGSHGLVGGSGNDSFAIGGGGGWVDGGGGADTVLFSSDNSVNSSPVVVTQSGGTTILSQAGRPNLNVSNVETIQLGARVGSGLNVDASASSVGLVFALTGMADVAIGGAGADRFSIVTANGMGDVLTGGGGADVFTFAGLSAFSGATITDLEVADTIQLSNLAPNTVFIGGLEFSGSGSAEYRYLSGNGLTGLLGDADGDGEADSALLIGNGAFVLAETSPGSGTLRIVGQLPANDAGPNTMTGTEGVDYLDSGAGDDAIDGRGGNDIVNAGEGKDQVQGGAGSDSIHGGDGDDVIEGGADQDWLHGDDGNDRITDAGGSGDWLVGGYGNDILTASNGLYQMFGDAGPDSEGDDRLTLVGGSSGSWIEGEGGNDIIRASGSGTIVLGGGSGDDDVTIGGFTGGHVRLAQGNDILRIQNGGGYSIDLDEGMDTVVLQSLTASTIIRDLDGGEQGDVLDLTAYGADPFGTGVLTIVQQGANTVVRHAASGVVLTLENVLAANLSAYNLRVANPLYAPVGLTLDDAFASDPTAAYASQLTGGDGNDTIRGYGGDDTLYGGGGGDRLEGGEGNDFADGGSGDDVLVDGAGEDWLIGGGGADSGTGGAGNDTLWGGEGGDLLIGGEGDDTLAGGTGMDTVSYADAVAGVEIDLSIVEDQHTRGAGTDTLSSIENLLGSAFDDVLAGNGSANLFRGGAGNDRFVFDRTILSARDGIVDFATGDLIDIRAVEVEGGDPDYAAYSFLGDAAFSGGNRQLRVTGSGTEWLVEGDINGDRVADFAIHVTTVVPGLGLSASDFLL